MKRITLLFTAILLIAITSCKNETKKESTEVEVAPVHKIISLNGAITEIVSALGYESQIIGVDVTSTFPETVKETAKDLGHVRSLTIESILELQPTLILASDRDINAELLNKIKESGIETLLFTQEFSVAGSKKLIARVAETLGKNDSESLIKKIDNDIAQVILPEVKPKVLFIYARGAGTLMVAGNNTPMKNIIEIAGGDYVITEFDDFKPLTPEWLAQSNPDIILLFDSGLQSLGGIDGLLQAQGVSQTNAGKSKKIISMEGGLLSGFGPRVGEAAKQLNQKLNNQKSI